MHRDVGIVLGHGGRGMRTIRYPEITLADERGQLEQIRSYLFSLADELNFALDGIEAGKDGESRLPSGSFYEPETEDDASGTFDKIKSLIIKSADIVTAYTDEITKRLSGSYVAETDFAKYRMQTEAILTETSSAVTQNYKKTEEILSELSAVMQTSAYIKTGELEDGIYGVEIGQTDHLDGEKVYTRFARFTSDRLTFYDHNGSPVAYISDYVLHIEHADVRSSLKLGSYLAETEDGIAFMWAGA